MATPNCAIKYSELEEAFRAKFHRVPRVIGKIEKLFSSEKRVEEVVNGFNVKHMQQLLSSFKASEIGQKDADLAETLAVYALYELPFALAVQGGAQCAGIIAGYDAKHYIEPAAREQLVRWICTHKQCSVELLRNVARDGSKFVRSGFNFDGASVSDVKHAVKFMKADEEMRRVEERYGVKFSDMKFELPQAHARVGKQHAYLLEAGDTRMATVGYDTVCCQHLNDAGESAMMYGLLAPKAGFWIVESGEKIVAQAEVWEGDLRGTPAFVFDNIEYANDGDVSRIYPTLRAWVEKCPYDNVIMGLGYNETPGNFPSCDVEPQRLDFDAVAKVVLDDDDWADIKEGYETVDSSIYTDVDNGVVWLKKDGVLQMPEEPGERKASEEEEGYSDYEDIVFF